MTDSPTVRIGGRDVPFAPVDLQKNAETINTYRLEDGTLLQVDTMSVDVKRLVGHTDANGNPVYVVHTTGILQLPPKALETTMWHGASDRDTGSRCGTHTPRRTTL